jgi:hypothetical protein
MSKKQNIEFLYIICGMFIIVTRNTTQWESWHCQSSWLLIVMLCSDVLSQTADTVKVWSFLRPNLLSLAVRLGVAVWVASTTQETYTRLMGQYRLGGGGGSSRGGFKIRSRILAPHVHTGRFSGFPVAEVLGSKRWGIRYCLHLFTLSTYSFGVELSYIISYLPSLISVPSKYLSGRQQYDVDSLNFGWRRVRRRRSGTICVPWPSWWGFPSAVR